MDLLGSASMFSWILQHASPQPQQESNIVVSSSSMALLFLVLSVLRVQFIQQTCIANFANQNDNGNALNSW